MKIKELEQQHRDLIVKLKELIEEWDLQTKGRCAWWLTQIAKKIDILRELL